MRIKMDIQGLDRIYANLRKLSRRAETDVLKKANRKAGAAFVQAAKARCPTSSGLLRKSLGMVARSYGRIKVMIIGPRGGFRRLVVERDQEVESSALKIHRRMKMSKKARLAIGRVSRQPRIQDPIKYAHLVEFGHVLRGRGKRGKGRVIGMVPPQPFMRPAFDGSAASALEIWRDEAARMLV